MANRVTIKAGKGRLVRLRDGRRMDEKSDPVLVDRDTYISRRLDCGDLKEVEVEPPPAASVPPAKAAAANDAKGA